MKTSATIEFRSKPAWQRLIIMLGGIFVNIVLTLVIYTTMFSTVGQSIFLLMLFKRMDLLLAMWERA
jgi:membrane-associated protease RseP (regulator of RpoE activity)